MRFRIYFDTIGKHKIDKYQLNHFMYDILNKTKITNKQIIDYFYKDMCNLFVLFSLHNDEYLVVKKNTREDIESFFKIIKKLNNDVLAIIIHVIFKVHGTILNMSEYDYHFKNIYKKIIKYS
jgi:hypothetical protein